MSSGFRGSALFEGGEPNCFMAAPDMAEIRHGHRVQVCSEGGRHGCLNISLIQGQNEKVHERMKGRAREHTELLLSWKSREGDRYIGW